jgi:hypothetical protein
MTEKSTYVTVKGVKEFWWESDALFISGRRCGSVFVDPTIVDRSGAPMAPGQRWLAEVDGPFEKKILGIFRRTTYGMRVIGAYKDETGGSEGR